MIPKFLEVFILHDFIIKWLNSINPECYITFIFYCREWQNKVDVNLSHDIRFLQNYGKTFTIFISGRSYSNLQSLAVVKRQLRRDQVL